MRDTLVLTILGNDRTGLVEALAAEIAKVGGNWEESRMARLAGQFAGILLVTVEGTKTDQLVASLRALDASGLQITMRHAAHPTVSANKHVTLEVTGQDRPGIVRDLARVLAERSVNVEQLESQVASAPMSGEAMFTARIRASVPAGVELADLRRRLEALAGELMVDLSTED
ncbi:MAG: ACT domain-containing protein [Kofleriaceae bacterium]|nr:ACT domain-containing protein [Kofleriaceae bacterium]